MDIGALAHGPVLAAFGEDIVYSPAVGGSLTIRGVFDDAYQASITLEDGSAGWTSTNPTLGIRQSDLPAPPKRNDRLVIRGLRYMVIDAHPDSHGWYRLTLGEAR